MQLGLRLDQIAANKVSIAARYEEAEEAIRRVDAGLCDVQSEGKMDTGEDPRVVHPSPVAEWSETRSRHGKQFRSWVPPRERDRYVIDTDRSWAETPRLTGKVLYKRGDPNRIPMTERYDLQSDSDAKGPT